MPAGWGYRTIRQNDDEVLSGAQDLVNAPITVS